jgi:hypothetical protein
MLKLEAVRFVHESDWLTRIDQVEVDTAPGRELQAYRK